LSRSQSGLDGRRGRRRGRGGKSGLQRAVCWL